MLSEISKNGFQGNKNIQNRAEWPFTNNLVSPAIDTRLYAYKKELLLVFDSDHVLGLVVIG